MPNVIFNLKNDYSGIKIESDCYYTLKGYEATITKENGNFKAIGIPNPYNGVSYTVNANVLQIHSGFLNDIRSLLRILY